MRCIGLTKDGKKMRGIGWAYVRGRRYLIVREVGRIGEEKVVLEGVEVDKVEVRSLEDELKIAGMILVGNDLEVEEV